MHRPQITLGQQSSLLSAGYGFSVWGEYLGTSESTVAHVQHASEGWPGRIADRGIFMLGNSPENHRETSDFNTKNCKYAEVEYADMRVGWCKVAAR